MKYNYDYQDNAWHHDLKFMKTNKGLGYMLKLARHAIVRLAKLDVETDALSYIQLANNYDEIAKWLLSGQYLAMVKDYYSDNIGPHADSSATYKRLNYDLS